jgi:integrase
MTARRDNQDGTLYQLPDGRWRAVTPRRAGATVRTRTTANKRDAAAWLKEVMANERFAERHPELVAVPEPPPTAQTVAALLDEYIARHVNGVGAETTQEGKRSSVLRAKRYVGALTVEQLDVDTYEAIEDAMVADGYSWSSIRKVRSVINLAWRKRRVRLPNPTADLDLPADVVTKVHDKIALTAEQRTVLVDAFAEHRMRAAVILQSYLGLRPGEVLGLCWDCVQLDGPTPTVAVRRQVATIRNSAVLVDRVKSASARRILFLPPAIADALRVHRQLSDGDGLLFPTRDGEPTGLSNWGDQLDRVVATTALPRVTPHELRHTASELMLVSGMSPREVADVLGHTTDELVQTTYRHRGEVVHASALAPDIG